MPENEKKQEAELDTGVVEATEEDSKESELKDADVSAPEDDKSFALDEDGEVRKPQKIDDSMIENSIEDAILVNPKRAEVQKYRSRPEIRNGVDFTKEDEIERIWTLLEEEEHDTPKKYDLKKADYTETDVLKHPTLGKGYILEILPNKKISVLFEDGLKRLAVNR